MARIHNIEILLKYFKINFEILYFYIQNEFLTLQTTFNLGWNVIFPAISLTSTAILIVLPFSILIPSLRGFTSNFAGKPELKAMEGMKNRNVNYVAWYLQSAKMASSKPFFLEWNVANKQFKMKQLIFKKTDQLVVKERQW